MDTKTPFILKLEATTHGGVSASVRVVEQSRRVEDFAPWNINTHRYEHGGVRLGSIFCPEFFNLDEPTLYVRGSSHDKDDHRVLVPIAKLHAIFAAVADYEQRGAAWQKERGEKAQVATVGSDNVTDEQVEAYERYCCRVGDRREHIRLLRYALGITSDEALLRP